MKTQEQIISENIVSGGLPDEQLFRSSAKRWRKTATWFVVAFFLLFAGYLIYQNLPTAKIIAAIKTWPQHIDPNFPWMILTGFVAQLVDGALGMGYGVTCTTVLLSLGINLPAISGSIHTAEMFSSGASGYSHYRFGNVNKKLFKAMLIPGIIGAVLGALLLWKLGDKYATYIRPVLAAYTLFLGVRILRTAFKKKGPPKKVKRVGWLAGAGGFVDSFGGGGWGPLVTSTLIAKGRTPRFVIGTVSITEFFCNPGQCPYIFWCAGHYPLANYSRSYHWRNGRRTTGRKDFRQTTFENHVYCCRLIGHYLEPPDSVKSNRYFLNKMMQNRPAFQIQIKQA